MTATKERLKIHLTDKYQITADSFQYILQEKSISESRNDYEKNIAYYGTLEQLVKGLLEREIKSSAVEQIAQLSVRVNRLARKMASSINVGL